MRTRVRSTAFVLWLSFTAGCWAQTAPDLATIKAKLEGVRSYSVHLKNNDYVGKSSQPIAVTESILKVKSPNLMRLDTETKMREQKLQGTLVFDGVWQWVDISQFQGSEFQQRTIAKVSQDLASPTRPFDTGYQYSGTGLNEGLDYKGTFLLLLELYDLKFVEQRDGLWVYSGPLNRARAEKYAESVGQKFAFDLLFQDGSLPKVTLGVSTESNYPVELSLEMGSELSNKLVVSELVLDPPPESTEFSYSPPELWAVFDFTPKVLESRRATLALEQTGELSEALKVWLTPAMPMPEDLATALDGEQMEDALKILRADPKLLETSGILGQKPINYFAEKGFLPGLEFAIAQGADLNQPGYLRDAPLHQVLELLSPTREEALKLLIEAGADLAARDYYGNTPLHLAPNQECIDLLREAGARTDLLNVYGRPPSLKPPTEGLPEEAVVDDGPLVVSVTDREGNLLTPDPQEAEKFAPLFRAITQSDRATVERFLKDGVDPVQLLSLTDEGGQLLLLQSPLDFAAASNMAMTRLLVERCDLESPEVKQEISLCLASARDPEVFEYLLGKGADPTVRPAKYPSLLFYYLNDYALKRLAGSGIDLALKDDQGQDALAHMISYNYSWNPDLESLQRKVTILCQAGADVDTLLTDTTEQAGPSLTPLQLAVARQDLAMSEFFLSLGADPNRLSQAEWAPLHLAAADGSVSLAASLLKFGADIQGRAELDWTPLHCAVQEGRLEMVRYLLSQGAPVNAVDQAGNSPLHLAQERNNLELIQLLLKAGADPNLKNKEGRKPSEL